ncbi:hypothetical protein SAY86_028842 [Trapa natans]|uniref:Uncharacterized protein n=1 Tax=Trapa natans TaxID=22666 RepID=A0AAN7RER4_TRANT|nr:hypothetical protein SAY86_028842 [Trapa natans]
MMSPQEDNGMMMKMSDISDQMTAPGGDGRGQGQLRRPNTDGLPTESSPYITYADMEDYKRQGYGTEGHLQPKPTPAGSGTDAPTVSGKAHP